MSETSVSFPSYAHVLIKNNNGKTDENQVLDNEFCENPRFSQLTNFPPWNAKTISNFFKGRKAEFWFFWLVKKILNENCIAKF